MAIATAQFTIVDLRDITTGPTASINPTLNMLWLDTSSVPDILKKWNGSSWVQTGASSLEQLDPSANTNLNDIIFDNKLAPSEKQVTKRDFDEITSEKTSIDAQADKYTISRTSYDNAYNTLNTYLTPLLADLTTTSNIDSATFRTNFKNYYDAKAAILQSIANKAKDLADAAQNAADNITIGGRNLLFGTNPTTTITSMSGNVGTGVTTALNLITEPLSPVDKAIQLIRTDLTSTGGGRYWMYNGDTTGIQYTWSLYAKGTGTWSIGSERGGQTNITLTSTYTKYTYTYTANSSSYHQFTFYTSTQGAEIDFYSLKLEEGNRATTWTAAPEDIDAEISQAQSDATKANGDIADMSSDSKLTPSEKIQLKTDMGNISAEKIIIDSQASAYSMYLTSELTNYDSSYTTLNSYVTPLLTDMTTTSDINGNILRGYFADYYTKKSTLLKKISDTAKSLADNAQDTADNIQVGGKNLYTDSSFEYGTEMNIPVVTSNSDGLLPHGGNKFGYISNSSSTVDNYVISSHLTPVITGQSYIISYWSAYGGSSYEASDYIYDQNGNVVGNLATHNAVTADKVWRRNIFTYTPAAGVTSVKLRFGMVRSSTAFGWAAVDDIKIEVGNKVTDWSPATEDMASKNDIKLLNNQVIKVRYIRDWVNGNTVNAYANWVEIQAMQLSTNLALNKNVTASFTPSAGILSSITNGNFDTNDNVYTTSSGPQNVVVDLGQIYDSIDYIQIWHYYGDNRTFHNSKTEISIDGVNWYTIFDSTNTGEYIETLNGHIIQINFGNVANRITSTEKRMTTAEQKITDSSIISTVTSSDTYTTTINNINNSIDTINNTNIPNAIDTAVNANQWLCKRYNIPNQGYESISYSTILGATPAQITMVNDSALNANSDGFLIWGSYYYNYVGYASTNVYVNNNTTISTQFGTDDNGVLYVNGKKIADSLSCININVNIPLIAGWNSIEVLWGQGTSSDGFYFIDKISQNSNVLKMQCSVNDISNGKQTLNEANINAAQQSANSAATIADSKGEVFTSQPVPPYNVGDIWVSLDGTTDFLTCAVAKTSAQAFAASDWVKGVKYTDDTTANAAQASANTANTNIATINTTTIPNAITTAQNYTNQVSTLSTINKGDTLFHFSNNLCSTQGLNPNSGYVATLRPLEGKFNGAVAIDETTTNLVSNPSFETYSNLNSYATGWSITIRGTNDATRIHTSSIVQSLGNSGTYAQKVLISSGASNASSSSFQCSVINITPSISYTASCYISASVVNKVNMSIRWTDSSGAYISDSHSTNNTLINGVERLVVTATSPSNAGKCTISIEGINTNGEWFIVDDVQLEQKSYNTSFTASTRNAGILTYNASSINPKNFSIGGWYKWLGGTGTDQYFAELYNNANDRFDLKSISGSNALFEYYNGTTFAKAGTTNTKNGNWHFIVFTCNGTNGKVYVDGNLEGTTGTLPTLSNSYSLLYISSTNGNPNTSSLWSEVFIKQWMQDSDIKALYNLGQPIYDANPNIIIPDTSNVTMTIL